MTTCRRQLVRDLWSTFNVGSENELTERERHPVQRARRLDPRADRLGQRLKRRHRQQFWPLVRPYGIELLFQPFRRLVRERIAGERGFGLGLSIARAISRAYQGDIVAVPRPQGGLDVTLRLPRAPAAQTRPTQR